MSDLLGMRGTGSWSNEERPTNFRQGMLQLFPNGDMPLTGMLSKAKSRKVDDPEFKYYSKTMETQGGAATGIYTNVGLSSAFGGTGSAGDTIYVKCAAATQFHFRPGHVAQVIDDSNPSQKIFGKVTSSVANGSSSYVAVKLLAACTSVTTADYIDNVGNANAEGAVIPDALSYAPSKFTNYTQIFRDALDITRTQKQTYMRIGDPYAEAKREAMQYHGIGMEMAAFFGEKTEGTGSNGQKERTTQGCLSFLNENNSSNIRNFQTSTALTWEQAGEDWFDESLEVLFRYGKDNRIAFCGSGALLGIQKLVKRIGTFSFTPTTVAYGIKVTRWDTPFGSIYLKRHPLFTSIKSYMTNNIVCMDLENAIYAYIQDTIFKRDAGQTAAGYQAIDGTKEEFLTEAGFEWHHPETFMWLKGVGLDGTGS